MGSEGVEGEKGDTVLYYRSVTVVSNVRQRGDQWLGSRGVSNGGQQVCQEPGTQ